MRNRIFSLVLLLVPAAPAAGQAADTAAMTRAEGLLDRACAADHDNTWHASLCGPLLLGHWGAQGVTASRQAATGGFTQAGRWWQGTLADGQYPANTAITLGGTPWSMVVLPLPESDAAATTLLVHEQFHRVQDQLGLPATNPRNDHLDDPAARRWLRLEWRALARAIADSGAASCRDAGDALAFRAARHQAFPGSDSTEAQLERNEGYAEYTGQRLAALVFPGGDKRLIDHLARAEATPSYVRSFAYATGPAYGFLLDRFDPAWRTAVTRSVTPATLLASRLGCRSDPATPAARTDRYGGQQLAADERHRADSLATIRADYVRRLVDGPVFETPPGPLDFTFDPNTIFPLGEHGVVYPTGSTYSGPWGTLQVTAGGALVSSDFQRVRVALPGDGVSKWTLTPAEGWEVVRDSTGMRLVKR